MRGLVTDYLRLRRAIGALGLLLPPALLLIAGPRESLSAYYHSPARDVFVAALATIAALLLAYRGHDRGDRICSAVAGVALLGVALAPVGGPLDLLHFVSSLVFFAAVAEMCRRFGFGGYRTRTFRVLAWVIVGGVLGAFGSNLLGWSIAPAESVAVIAFGAAWLIKGRALEAIAGSQWPRGT